MKTRIKAKKLIANRKFFNPLTIKQTHAIKGGEGVEAAKQRSSVD